MNKSLTLLIIFLTITFYQLDAQQTTAVDPELVQAELAKQGVSEEEVRAKLEERGIDIDNISPQELLALEPIVEEIIAEIKEEQELRKADTLSLERVPNILYNKDPFGDTMSIDTLEIIEIEEKDSTFIPIYGHDIFKKGNIKTFQSINDAVASDNYVLGQGDKLSVSIFGRSQENASFTLDENGVINPTGMSKINLKGLTLKAAKKLLISRYKQYYNFKQEEFAVTVDQTRMVVVNVYGEVRNSGSFSMSGSNTAINAIVEAGGVKEYGSIRNIKLIRASGDVIQLDLYDWLAGTGEAKDIQLMNNDVVHVPVASNIVSVKGGVNRPMRYEVRNGEKIGDIVRFAGGLSDNGYNKNIQVKRFQNGQLIFEDTYLEDNFSIINGDEILIRTVKEEFKNYVFAEGAFEFGGFYQYEKGMKVSDLVDKAKLSNDAYLDVAFIQKEKPDGTFSYVKVNLNELLKGNQNENILLSDKDKLIVYSQKRFSDELTFSINGAVRVPGEYPFDNSGEINFSDAITIAGDVLPNASEYGFIYRRDPFSNDLVQYYRVDIGEIKNNPTSAQNIALRPLDSIVIYDRERYIDSAMVEITGAVRKPDSYLFDPTLKLKDLILLSGGLKLEASKSKVQVARMILDAGEKVETEVLELTLDDDLLVNGENFELSPYDIITIRSLPEFEFQKKVKIEGEVVYPGEYAIVGNNENISTLINRANGLTSEAFPEGATFYRSEDGVGFIVVQLDEILKNPNHLSNLKLKDGDVISIPKSRDFVTITGETKAIELYPEKILQQGKFNVPYAGAKSARWYVDQYAAGLGENGRSRLITVQQPNGQIKKTVNYLFFKKYPKVEVGSIIKVGKVEEKILLEKEKEKVDWAQVFSQSIAQATSILSLILLLQRID